MQTIINLLRTNSGKLRWQVQIDGEDYLAFVAKHEAEASAMLLRKPKAEQSTRKDVQIIDLAEGHVQYIQYNWDVGCEKITEYYSYSFQEWEECQPVPNMQLVGVAGLPLERWELEEFIKNQPPLLLKVES